MMKTKWDHLVEKRAQLQAELDRVVADMEWMERTPCSAHPCDCGYVYPTEADFAKHFVVSQYDQRMGHWNLGNCPVKVVEQGKQAAY